MEQEPDTENIFYMDEYPELEKRVWLRRLQQQRSVGKTSCEFTLILSFPEQPDPDPAA